MKITARQQQGRSFRFPTKLSSITSLSQFHNNALKSLLKELPCSVCSSESCAGRCSPKHGQEGLDILGWCSSKPADVYTSNEQPASHLHPTITTAGTASAALPPETLQLSLDYTLPTQTLSSSPQVPRQYMKALSLVFPLRQIQTLLILLV